MGRFAKALSRKHEKKYKKSEERVEAAEKKSKHAVQHATTKQLIEDRTIMAGAYDTLTLIFDVAVHETFGWGVDMRARLHKKMARHILCMKSRLVTTKDIERILRDEVNMEPEKEDGKQIKLAKNNLLLPLEIGAKLMVVKPDDYKKALPGENIYQSIFDTYMFYYSGGIGRNSGRT